MKTILRRLADFQSFTLAILAMLTVPQPGHAQGSKMYEFEGVQFDAAERERIGAADAQLQRGVSALKRSDWATARRECSAAYESFVRVRLPDRGLGAQAYKWALACIADAQSGSGDWYMACRTYSGNGYFSLRMENARQMCVQKGAAQEATPAATQGPSQASHSEYAGTFAAFAGRLTRLNTLPGGSARTALAQELNGDCARLRGFGQRIPPAPAATGYCAGIVAFEQGRSGEACRSMWSSAGSIRTALRGQMLQEQRNHGVELQGMLDTFRPICGDMGYTWPGFDQAWPH
jgi:hypothetical protein